MIKRMVRRYDGTKIFEVVASRWGVVGSRLLWLSSCALGVACFASEEISYPTTVHCPKNQWTIAQVKKIRPKVYAEFGISDGATVLEIAKVLPSDGEIYLFDFYDKVATVAARLRDAGFGRVHAFGNSYKYRDSYNWSLLQVLESATEPIFDYVYLDGLHMWETDALTFFLVNKLLRPEGYIDFDDYGWKMINSKTCGPQYFPLHAKMWTTEQMNTPCVKKIVDLLVVRDDRYEFVAKSGRNRLFKKIR